MLKIQRCQEQPVKKINQNMFLKEKERQQEQLTMIIPGFQWFSNRFSMGKGFADLKQLQITPTDPHNGLLLRTSRDLSPVPGTLTHVVMVFALKMSLNAQLPQSSLFLRLMFKMLSMKPSNLTPTLSLHFRKRKESPSLKLRWSSQVLV